jgi:hypothetical protein
MSERRSRQSETGTCFGYAVSSSLPFGSLRNGGGESLEVVTGGEEGPGPRDRLIFNWSRPRFQGQLYSDGRDYRFWVKSVGWFVIEPEIPRIAVPPDEDPVLIEELVWGIPAALCFLHRGDMSLHAAAVEVDGGAVILAAPGTFGKSTLAAAFHRAGFRLLSEDVTCTRVTEQPAVVPGPATVRLRRDVGELVDLPAARRIDTGKGRVRFILDPAQRGDCGPVPIRAVVMLRASSNGFRLDRVAPASAIPDVWRLGFHARDADRARRFQGVVDLVGKVPAWNLYRPLRLEDLPTTVEQIVEHV